MSISNTEPKRVIRFLLSIDNIDKKTTSQDFKKIHNEWDRYHSLISKYISSFQCNLCPERKLDDSSYCVSHIKIKTEMYHKYKSIEEEINKVLSENKTTMTIKDIRKGNFKKENFIEWKFIGGLSILVSNIAQARRQYQLTFHKDDPDINHEEIITNYEKLNLLLNNIRVITNVIPDILPCPIMFQTVAKTKNKKKKKQVKKKQAKKEVIKSDDILESRISVSIGGIFTDSLVDLEDNIFVGTNIQTWNTALGIFTSSLYPATMREEIVKSIDIKNKTLHLESGKIIYFNGQTWLDESKEYTIIMTFRNEEERKFFTHTENVLSLAFNTLNGSGLLNEEIKESINKIQTQLTDGIYNNFIIENINRWSIVTNDGTNASIPMFHNLVIQMEQISRRWLHLLMYNQKLITNDKLRDEIKSSFIIQISDQIMYNKKCKEIPKMEDKTYVRNFTFHLSGNTKFEIVEDCRLIFASDSYIVSMIKSYMCKIKMIFAIIDGICKVK